MVTANIKLENESKIVDFLGGKTFKNDIDLCNNINEYMDEKNFDEAVKSDKIRRKLDIFAKLVRKGNG